MSPEEIKNLKVPNSEKSSKRGTMSILDAYNSQSKVPLIDGSTSMSSDGITGDKAKNISMEALRPKTVSSYSEDGRPVYDKSNYEKDIKDRSSIRDAYMKMNGQDPSNMDDSNEYDDELTDSSIEYIEDVPEDDEGLLMYIETCINNAEANLEMLKSLYAALKG